MNTWNKLQVNLSASSTVLLLKYFLETEAILDAIGYVQGGMAIVET